MTERRLTFLARCALLGCLISVTSSTAARAQFTPGTLVVSVIGDGDTTVGTTAVPITLQEFTQAGVATGTNVTLPTVDAGSNLTPSPNLDPGQAATTPTPRRATRSRETWPGAVQVRRTTTTASIP